MVGIILHSIVGVGGWRGYLCGSRRLAFLSSHSSYLCSIVCWAQYCRIACVEARVDCARGSGESQDWRAWTMVESVFCAH